MTWIGAIVTTASLALCAFVLLMIGALALNPFGESDSTGRLMAAACAVASVPTAGAGAFIAYRQRREMVWLLIAVIMSSVTLAYVVVTFPPSFD